MSQTDSNLAYFDALAADYHLLYRDWQATLERERANLRRWLRDHAVSSILDASCGPGTQAIPLAQLGYRVLASDPSNGMLREIPTTPATAAVIHPKNLRRDPTGVENPPSPCVSS